MSSILIQILDKSIKNTIFAIMSISKNIKSKIDKIKEGETFTYQNLDISKSEYLATAKVIERLIDSKIIKRISTGVFYKPKQTIFGELKPNEDEIIKPYLFSNGKRIAYITGTSLYNKMGLTTQVPKEIKIASREKRIFISKGSIKASAIKSYVDVTDKNYQFLELLDTLKDFNKIPDLNRESAIEILMNKLKELTSKEKKELVKICIQYPPRVNAFLGALLENIGYTEYIELLRDNLNPFTKFDIAISEQLLPTIKKWNIR